MPLHIANILPFTIAFLVATLFGLLFVTPDFFARTDILALWSANNLFLTGGNPFSQSELLATELAANPKLGAVLPIWNPPLLFITIGPFASFHPPETVLSITLLRALCATTMAITGFTLSRQRAPSALIACLIVACSPAYFAEVAIGQYSSFVCASFAIGYLLLSRRFDFWAGAVLFITILKPHDVLLPACLIAFRVVHERRWNVLTGAFTASVVSIGVLEYLRPGIHTLWLNREAWPVHVFGSTLPSAIRSATLSTHGFVPWWPLVAIPLLGIGCLYAAVKWFGLYPREHSTMMLAIGLNTIFSPYGFVFDNCILITPIAYYYATLSKSCPQAANKALIIFAIATWAVLCATFNSWTLVGRPFWFTFSICSVIAIFLAERRLSRTRTEQDTRSFSVSAD